MSPADVPAARPAPSATAPSVTPPAPPGRKLLFLINGGLGDAAELTRTLVCAMDKGAAVSVMVVRGQAALMVPIWALVPGLRVLSREDAEREPWDCVLCSTTDEALRERSRNLRAGLIANGNPGHGVHMVTNNQRLLIAAGYEDVPVEPEDMPAAPLAALLAGLPRNGGAADPDGHPIPDGARDLILAAPGVGRYATDRIREAKEAKLYPRWPELLTYLPPPVTLIGDLSAKFPWLQDLRCEVRNLIGGTNDVLSLLPWFARARILFAVDNGLHHLAALFGVPVASIWTGATDPRCFAAPGAQVFDSRRHSPGQIANALHLAEHPRCALRTPAAPAPAPGEPVLSVVIPTHNEGDEVAQTCRDVLEHADCAVEILVVDDGSTDRSCDQLPAGVKVIRTNGRLGVAPCRNLGVKHATGAAFMFLDAHMRLTPGAGRIPLRLALEQECIVQGGMAPLYNNKRPACWDDRWLFRGRLRVEVSCHAAPAPGSVNRITAFRAPGWCLSRKTWEHIGPWPAALSGWGSTEVCMGLRAGLAGVPIFQAADVIVWHRFRGRFPYHVSPANIVRNAVVAGVTSFGLEGYQRFLRKPMMLSGDWIDSGHQPLTDPVVLAEEKRFAAIRTVTPEAWFRQYLPSMLPPQ